MLATCKKETYECSHDKRLKKYSSNKHGFNSLLYLQSPRNQVLVSLEGNKKTKKFIGRDHLCYRGILPTVRMLLDFHEGCRKLQCINTLFHFIYYLFLSHCRLKQSKYRNRLEILTPLTCTMHLFYNRKEDLIQLSSNSIQHEKKLKRLVRAL